MFRALMGGGRSSSDVRSSTSSSKSGSRRRTDSKASSTASRKSSRGDDRDRGLGDLSTYPTAGGRNKRYAASAAGESVASSYATADPGFPDESDRMIIERRPGRWDTDDGDRPRDRDWGDRDRQQSARRRDRVRSPSPDRERSRRAGTDDRWEDDDRASVRRERQRVHPDVTLPPISTAIPTTAAGGPVAVSPNGPAAFDPHVQQQFPGQFPALHAEPYRPPNPAGEAADYYGDQGQSVAEQPGIRPAAPEVLPNNQAHLMPASPSANPPPEPSSVGGVGAAAAYYNDAADGGAPAAQAPGHPPLASPADTLHSSHPSVQSTGAPTYGVGDVDSPAFPPPSSATSFAPPMASHHAPKPSHSHGGAGATVGMAAAAAGAGYMMGHHHPHHSSSSSHGSPLYPPQPVANAPYDAYASPSMYPPHANPALYGAGAGAVGYAAHPSHPHHAALYHGPSFQSGGMAFQQRRRGPLDRFVDFWRDPDGVGMFEDYTESIGVCKYCFEPGSTSRDAPRKHHYQPRRLSGDRRSGHSRVEKLSRYTSSEDEGRHRKRSSRSSWIPGLLGGYAIKSLFNTKDFEDTYSVRSGRVPSSHGSDGGSISGRKSDTSRGVYRRRSHDRLDRSSYSDMNKGRYGESRRRSRSRSRSASRPHHHSALRDAALGAAVGTAAGAVARSRQRSNSRSRSRSPRKSKGRKSSSSDSSFVDIGHPSRKSTGGAFGSFFTASSENRRKRRGAKKPKGLFSFNNSSSSSTDADLAFGSGYAKRPPGTRKNRRKKQDRDDVDAKLLGLGAAATALAASPHGRSRRPGEVLLGKESRTSRSDYASSATNDDGWEDLDSSDQSSSSVSSALAFGGHSALFSSDDSSDSGTSKWGWRWGSKRDKKGKKEKQKKKKRAGSSSSDDRFPTGAAALGVGALGTAALAAAASSRRHASHDSTGSLQHVEPVPTSDPSRFDTVRVPPQPAFVRPGPIPLQQPQPVTPVSQAVYTSQGESIHAYTAPTAGPPPFKTPFENYTSQSRDRDPRSRGWDQRSSAYVDRSEAQEHIDGLHRRSNTFPAFPTEPLEGSTVSNLRRRATTKDQASVSFDLTEEQERRADRRERESRNSDFDGRVQLIDNEREPTRPEDDRWSRWRRGEGEHDRRAWDEGDKQRQRDSRGNKSSSWVGPAAVGAIGAAAAVSALSGRSSKDDSSETSSQRRHDERREKRRAERRRGSEQESASAALSVAPSSVRDTRDYPSYSPWSPEPEPAHRDVSRTKPKYEDYAEFFAPEEVRHSPDASPRESRIMPTIIEVEPASERPPSPIRPDPEYIGRLPWKVPDIMLTKPTPPHSVSGSVRDAASPVPRPQPVVREEESPERPVTFSRVSWGEHETHEYEVPSSESEHDSVDHDRVRRRERGERPERTRKESSGKGIGEDIAFAATVAAATAAAGFDPTLVTDDPKYHTRWSPPHGSFPRVIEEEGDESLRGERPSRARDVAANGASRDKPESPTDVAVHMPGGFEEPERQADSRDASIDDPRSVVSAPAPGESAERVSKDLQRRVSGDTEEGDDAGSPSVESGSAEGKKKRRKKHSKRRSDGLDDSASVASSPANIGDASDKRRGTREKSQEEKPGSFFKNIFGSRVSEPVESKRPSSSSDRRETRSEIGSRSPEESRHRRRERSSRHRSSNRDEGLDDDDDSAHEDDDKENINVESYKASRQRRQERRRQQHEWDKAEESEKDRELSPDHTDEERSFLAEAPQSPPVGSLETAGVTGLGLDVVDSAPVSQSRPSSPKVIERQTEDDNEGPRSRRSSVVRSTESPTAVPLHFRRPPTSPATQRSPSEGSAAVQPPESPTQSRPRRPNSSEFVFSREIRPLWLVERHGATKPEPQDENEPLPSLPSSKTSSANASVEDLTALPDEKTWETTDLSHHIHGDRPRELDLSSAQEYHEILGSQQGTPTAGSFYPSHPHSRPSSLRKEGSSKPKYEFHSPSELLQDPTAFAALPPSPTLGTLPSVVGSAVGAKEEDDLENLPALPLSRPTTPESKNLDSVLSDVDTTPTQKRVVPARDSPEHSGIPSAMEGAIAAAAGAGVGVLAADKGIPDEPTETAQVEQTLVPQNEVLETDDVKRPATPTQSHIIADEKPVAAEHADESPKPDTESGEALREIEVPQDTLETANESTHVDMPQAEPQPHPEQEDAVPETPTSSSSKKKKKKKKKGKSVDDSSIQESETVSEPAASEPEPASVDEKERSLGESKGEVDVLGVDESKRPLDMDSTQTTEQESAIPDVVNSADIENDESNKALAAEPAEQLPEQEPSTMDASQGAAPENEESSKALDIEHTQSPEHESAIPDVENTADTTKDDMDTQPNPSATTEDSAPDATSKKSKRDKKKKKKGKNAPAEAAAEESQATETSSEQPAVDTPAEENPSKLAEEEPKSFTQQDDLPVEEPSGTTEVTEADSKGLPQHASENTSAEPAVSAPDTADVKELPRDGPLPEASDAQPSLDAAEEIKPTQDVLPESSDAQPPLDTAREIEPTQEEDKPTTEQPETPLAESTPDAEHRERQDSLNASEEWQDAVGEPMREDIPGTNEEPVSMEQQEPPLEAPVGEPSSSPDEKDTAAETEPQKDTIETESQKAGEAATLDPEPLREALSGEPSASPDQKDNTETEPQKEGEAATLESEPLLSRKSSKKKKNKRKSATEPETEPAETASQPEVPTEQQQEAAEEAAVEAVVDTPGEAEAEAAESAKSKEEASPEENSGEQPGKKSKKKKKKNKSLSLTESQPETTPEQAESDAQTSGELPPPAPAADVVASPPQPEEDSIANEDSTKEIENDATEGTLDNKPDNSLVEISEANDGPPHVSESPAVESVPEPDAGEPTPTGKKGKKNKKKKQRSASTTSAPDESSTPLTADPADASADVPAAVEQPSSPTQTQEPEQGEPDREISGDASAAALDPSQASIDDQPPADLPAASEEPPVTKEPEQSLEAETPANNPSAAEEPPTSLEPAPEQEKSVENEPSVDPSEAPQDPAASEPAPPMTAAQKKKAKKDKKKNKKQQQASESVDETPAVEEPKPAEENVSETVATTEPADNVTLEQPKDVDLDTTPAAVEEQAKEAEASAEPADNESPEKPKDTDLDTTAIAAEEPSKKVEETTESPDNESAEQSKEAGLDTSTIAADELPKEDDGAANELQEVTEDAPVVVSEEATSADIDSAQKDKVDAPESVEEPKQSGDAPESSAEAAPTEAQEINAEDESKKADIEPGTEQPAEEAVPGAEERPEQTPVEEEPTAATEDVNSVDEKAAEVGSQEQVEESQPATSSKSKKKNKKKKRQSVSLEEEPSTPVADETTAEPPSEVSPETTQAPEQLDRPQEEEKTLAVEESTGSTENAVSEEVPQEPPADQEEASESKEEPQPTVSKKKAKKDRKKRKSVSFAADDTPEQTSELAETGEAVAKPEDTPPSENPKDESATQPSEEPQVTTPATGETTEETAPVTPEQSEPGITADADETPAETPAEVASEEPKSSEPADAEGAEPAGQLSTEAEPATEAPSHENSITSKEGESSEAPQDTTPVDAPEIGDQTLADTPSEEPATQEPTVEASSPTATDEAPEPVSSKKDKKKKKKKNKKNAVEASEDVPAAVPEADVASENKEEPDNTPAAAEDDSGAAVPEAKSPEEDPLQTEVHPETEEQSKDQVPEESVLEPENQPAEATDSAPPTLDAAVEEKQPEGNVQPPETPTGEGEGVAMSAKEKRKAKKKKRKSKGPDTADESPTAEASSQGLSEQAPRSADAEPSETAPAPAEDDGKDNQSHGTDMHATNDEDMTWTDKMVSSQVEQQQEVTSPQSPSRLAPEQIDLTPSGEEHRRNEPEDDNGAKDQGSGVAEPELQGEVDRGLDAVQEGDGKVAEAGSEVVVKEAAGEEKETEQEKHGGPSTEAQLADTDKADESVVDVPAEQEAERIEETTEDPATEHAVETGLPQEQPSTSSDPAADEQEAPETTTSSKKKNKKEKKKQRQAQKLAESLQEEAKPTEEMSPPMEETTAPVSAGGQGEAIPEASQDVIVSPEESIVPKEIESPQVPEAGSLIPAEGNEKDVDSVLPAERELKEGEATPEAEPAVTTEQARETTVDETVSDEPAKEIPQIPESQEPVEDTSLERGQQTAELTPEGKEIPISDMEAIPRDLSGEGNAEEAEPVKEEPAAETLSRKESKKKKKKAKKQGKDQPEQPPSSAGDEKEGSPTTIAMEPSTENAEVAAESLPMDSPEQDQQRERADIVDSSKEPPDAEGPEVNTSMEPQDTPQDEAEREVSRNEGSRQLELGNGLEDVKPAARAEEKEEGDAPEAVASPTEQPETAAPLTRKLSKKEKRKAKQKASQGVREPEPEQEQAPVPEPEPKAHPAASTEDHPVAETTPTEPTADEPPVSRTPSTEEEKKRKGQQVEKPEEPQSLKREVEPAQNEQTWPAIEIGWDKGKDNFDKADRPPEHTLRRQTSRVASIFPELERGMFRRPSPPQRSESVKDGAEDESGSKGVQISEAPTTTTTAGHGESSDGASRSMGVSDAKASHEALRQAPVPTHERPSTPVDSTAKTTKQDRPSRARSLERDSSMQQPRTPPPRSSIFGGPPGDAISPPRTPLRSIRERDTTPEGRVEKPDGSRPTDQEDGTPRLEMRPEHVLPRPETPVRKFTDNAMARQRWPTPDKDRQSPLSAKGETRHPSRVGSPSPWRVGTRTPELQDTPILRPSDSTRSLRRTMRSTSGDLRATSRAQGEGEAKGKEKTQEARAQSRDPPQPPELKSASDLNLERIPSSSTYDPITDKGKRPLRNMADVYEGWGQNPGSPRSPNRPPSVRHRRSMQHLQELEAKMDQLISENSILLAAKDAAEDKLRRTSVARRRSDNALNRSDADLRDRSAEVEQLRNSVDWLQKEVARLTEEKDGLLAANTGLTQSHAQELETLQQSSTRELNELRAQHEQLTTTVQDRVRQEVETALSQKNQELRRLRQELESARDKVQELQQQIAASMNDGVLVFRDEDYFDAACQKLCGHVQQWVLRFSKHSDHRRCRKLGDLQDEKVADRFDNAILDGFDTDSYLADRVRRRDVFMSVVMTMVWEFIFTRYLFGMDREQRQKLKSLEKQLAEIGPRTAVHRWRATTLTLLAKRPAFSRQRESDTEAVALEIFDTLSRLLPPPSHVEAQLLESLRKVLRVAAALSIEMRTQLAEYIMLPPLQPEYDTNGDLTRQVSFNAALMNERSGETTSNEELEKQEAVVRVVLFPLVVKKGNDLGEGEDEVVVCPAQVLIARPEKDKRVVKVLSGDRMSVDTRSVHSIAPSSMMDISGSNVI